MNKIEKIKKLISSQLKELDRSIVATPTVEYLESFTRANGGSNDFLLVQLGKNFGYKLALDKIMSALEDIQEEPEKERPTYLLKTLCYGNQEYFHYEDEAELEMHISALHKGDRGLAYVYTDNRVVVNSIARDHAVMSYDVVSTEEILRLVEDYIS